MSKTQLRLSEDNLILLVKNKGDSEWEVESNMTLLGPLSESEWQKLWPIKNVLDFSSPPKGQNISANSSDEMEPKK